MIHPLSDVQTKQIGKKTQIWQFCVVLEGAIIGNNCNINAHVFIENDVIIENNVTVKSGVQLWDGLRIKSNVFIGPNVTFVNDLVPRSKQYPERFEQTQICLSASIGANATILSGLTIGKYALVGAGSVVTRNIPPYQLWVGNPAVHKGYITKEGILINLNLKDKSGKNYRIVNYEPLRND